MDIDREEIARLTEKYGGAWGINHTHRLLKLIALIGESEKYDADVVWLAAHLHDWGGYPQWARKGMDHALRSGQVAESFLLEKGYPEDLVQHVLECIELHHTGGPDRSLEAILLCDADALDFLGVVGVLRDFSKNPQDLRRAYEVTRQRREKLFGMICLPRAKAMAAERIRQMDTLLAQFERDSFGCF